MNNKTILTILLAGLIAGTADALAAIFILAAGNAAGVFKYIASALYGKQAFTGGADMIIIGIICHYIIAFTFVTFYYFIYPHVSLLRYNKYLSAFLYGIFTWLVMNLIVVPMTKIHQVFTWHNALLNAVILMFTIGLPAALIVRRRSTV